MKQRKQRPVLELGAPWVAPPLEEPIIYAIKAINSGNASGGQQQNFLRWLIQDLCHLNRTAFHAESVRATDFALGMEFVARVIASAIENPVKREPDPRGPPPETPTA